MTTILNLLAVGRDIQWQVFGLVLGIFLALALIFTVFILIITKVCHIQEDEKAVKILNLLGGSNCGGCGQSGCAAFAKQLAEGKGDPTACHSCPAENRAEIAKILGKQIEDEGPTVAVVHCAGGDKAANKFEYNGYADCTSRSGLLGGQKLCPSGCLGGGTCEAHCPSFAIHTKNGVSSVDRDLCTSCGVCMNKCPKHLIGRIPRSAKVYVACSNNCRGKEAKDLCEVSCIGCGLCAKNCPEGAITMVNNLPVIDYKKCVGCKVCVQKCPRHSIKEIED